MIDEILKGIEYAPVRFLQPPKAESYAVYLEDKDYSGPDQKVKVVETNTRIEIYEKFNDDDTVTKIKERLISKGIEFEQSEKVWLNSELVYMTTISFYTIEKIKQEELRQ